jgi:glycerate kinase
MLLGGRVRSGADYFLTLLGADELLAGSDFVVTGEGSLDEQSLSGKLPVALARGPVGRAHRCTRWQAAAPFPLAAPLATFAPSRP